MKVKKNVNDEISNESIESVSSIFNEKKKELTLEEKYENERRQLGIHNYNRKIRRSHLKKMGLLKAKNKFRFGSEEWKKWYNKTLTEGKRFFEENNEAVRKQQEWYLERIFENKKESLTNFYRDKMHLSKAEIEIKVNEQLELLYNKEVKKIK